MCHFIISLSGFRCVHYITCGQPAPFSTAMAILSQPWLMLFRIVPVL
ncbi:hypothetical protein CZ787_11735 [Halomonas citrativorans]|uniref:Uncharacterized protein n=1 Tax=Halomonas citrativorans TaxID=2742612 RepID=A0A1R4I1X8_9GAMM|nr:hypothetical protein CZ787_11735 [Halomonas citrativorans]